MKTVITYGVFDLFHEGHARLLERAKALGDKLIVGVTTDQYAYQRGKLCTVDPMEKRMENVRACPFVDQVIIEDHDGQKVEDINRLLKQYDAMRVMMRQMTGGSGKKGKKRKNAGFSFPGMGF